MKFFWVIVAYSSIIVGVFAYQIKTSEPLTNPLSHWEVITDNHFHTSHFIRPSISDIQPNPLSGRESSFNPNIHIYEDIVDAYNIQIIIITEPVFYWETSKEFKNFMQRRAVLIGEVKDPHYGTIHFRTGDKTTKIYRIKPEPSKSLIAHRLALICSSCINNNPTLYSGEEKDCGHIDRENLKPGILMPGHLFYKGF